MLETAITNCGIIGRWSNKHLPFIYSYLFTSLFKNVGAGVFNLNNGEEFPILMHLLGRFNFKYLNIADSYKSLFCRYADDADKLVIDTGAANMGVYNKGNLTVYNTEACAILWYFKKIAIKSDDKVLIFGNGDVLKSILWSLSEVNVSNVTVVSRSNNGLFDNMFKINKLSHIYLKKLKKQHNFDIIINTIPIYWSNPIWLNAYFPDGVRSYFDGEPRIVLDIGFYDSFLSIWSDNVLKYSGCDICCKTAILNVSHWFDTNCDFDLLDLKPILEKI